MSNDKRILTIRVELPEGAESVGWIWESHKAFILKQDAVRHGVIVTGMFEHDLIAKNDELQEELDHYRDEYGPLEEDSETLSEDDFML